MTAFDLAASFDFPGGEEWPDYTQENVIIQTELDIHENGTVTISYHHVPLLDVDDFLMLMGTAAVRAEILDRLADMVIEKFEGLAEMLPIPFEVTEIV